MVGHTIFRDVRKNQQTYTIKCLNNIWTKSNSILQVFTPYQSSTKLPKENQPVEIKDDEFAGVMSNIDDVPNLSGKKVMAITRKP